MDDRDKGWNHLVKVLRLTEDQQRALEDRGVDDIYLFHGSGGLGLVDFFAFDNETNIFPQARRVLMSDAWKWIDNHMGSIDDDDDWNWFVGNFRKTSFQRELSREKRAAEAKLRDEEDKRYKTAEPNQANASSFAASGTRTMTGVATMPPIFHDHLVPEHVKAHFTNIFEDDPSDEDKRKIDILVNGLLATGTSYNLKSVPETSKDPTSRTVQPHHLDFIATQFEGQVTTERIFKDGVDKNTRRSLADLGLTGGISNTGSFPEAYFCLLYTSPSPRD